MYHDDSSTAESVREIIDIAIGLGCDCAADESRSLEELGADRLDVVEIESELEDEFCIRFTPVRRDRNWVSPLRPETTVAECIALVKLHLGIAHDHID